MNKKRATIIFSIILALGSSDFFLTSCKEKSREEMIVFTRVSGKNQNINYITGDSWRYINQAQIMAIDPGRPKEALKQLTREFFSARSPEISYDGKYMLFTAQQKKNDSWQIWEMDLASLKARQVTFSAENCIDPCYLPGGRVVFSRLSVKDTLKAGHSLFTCNTDGSDLKRITFNPHTYLASNMLNDGRVLTIGRQVYPDQGSPLFFILRPDGTKAQMFYKGPESSTLLSCGRETVSGKIVFIESEKGNSENGNVISVNYNRPLHSRVNVTSGIEGDFLNVFPKQSGKFLVTYRKSSGERYSLYEFDPENKVLGKAIYDDSDYDVLEVVVAEKHERPKKLPSEVDMGVKSGLLLCQDINVFQMKPAGSSDTFSGSSRIEVLGIDSTMGTVQVEKDGSFYLKIIADKPFKIQTIDKNGNVLHGPCGWIWLRPNERRGCIGCHEDPELAPENKVPLAVKKPPVTIPVHINKVVEKKVTLE
jgi:hypothetical protein